MSSTAAASVVIARAIFGCVVCSRLVWVAARRASNTASVIPVAARAAGSKRQQEIALTGEDPVASPAPERTSANASIRVLRRLGLNWRSPISFVGVPNRCRIKARARVSEGHAIALADDPAPLQHLVATFPKLRARGRHVGFKRARAARIGRGRCHRHTVFRWAKCDHTRARRTIYALGMGSDHLPPGE